MVVGRRRRPAAGGGKGLSHAQKTRPDTCDNDHPSSLVIGKADGVLYPYFCACPPLGVHPIFMGVSFTDLPTTARPT